ncbi:acyl-CoA thioesterase [Anoxybacillus flavithermus]|jgi:acyl-CoA hydrolase|uniref:acyl-CoA thioesterase n=1 Tax=Anoxybacillus flavithermus TaxID=33934 RepID=UPI0018692DD2|nr:acyl-CoA thioesterase [Anoxybacillus flavithermus]MBE2941312.1 acyl-CoA thioesterase [Anoxybacillus flavithermus]MBE2943494.1 acyl-CoA thioesterase [Anoxybacillus flavithermus]MBE2951818.1 acyl-CoA thioesterase [Anoxybacillus flavithermus]MBE2954403.1 acyl-CoA thioesterase [Anoxybacillus flavithermus]MBE2959819.1 acyl-CoA thioesterase [Anoxybacillus flavithermus]
MEVSVEQSKTIQTRLVLPSDTNHLGTIFGGTVLAYIDEIAAISAMRHARKAVVTVSIDKVDFISSAKVGDILKLEAFVYSTGRTSMKVFVKVETEDLFTGEHHLTTTCFLTMVAIDQNKKPTPVPKVIISEQEEQIVQLYQQNKRINKA